MAEAVELRAWARETGGKGGARAVRREGRIPAIIYGDTETPTPVAVDYVDVLKQLNTGHFQSTIFMLDLDGSKTRVIPKDVQRDPVKDFPIHVDFLRVGKNASVTIAVPVHFLNEDAAPGLKRGGVLNVVRHDIEVRCPANAIPEAFEVDLTGLNIGDSIHISSISMPKGAEPVIADRDFTIATITGHVAEGDASDVAETEEEAVADAEGSAEGEAAEEAEGGQEE